MVQVGANVAKEEQGHKSVSIYLCQYYGVLLKKKPSSIFKLSQWNKKKRMFHWWKAGSACFITHTPWMK